VPSKNIHILIPWHSHLSDLHRSNLASIRLRSAVVFEYLKNQGHLVSIGEQVPANSDIIIVGKIGANNIVARAPSWLDSIAKAKSNGSKIFLDYTDHHLGFDSSMSIFYKAALDIVDTCVTPSEHLKFKLSEFFSGEIHVIPDPIEISVSPPKLVTKIKTILWFGHASNVGYLIQWLEGLPAGNSFNLIGLTNENGFKLFSTYRFSTRAQVHAKFFDWSIENMIESVKYADFCVIPSDINDPRKSGASSNRLLTALALGLPTAATILPSYREFSEYFLNLESCRLALELSEIRKLTEKVVEAQAHVIPRYSMKGIGQRWVELLEPS
jgi:hypothetical protein